MFKVGNTDFRGCGEMPYPLGGCLNRLPALLLVLLIFEYWALSFLDPAEVYHTCVENAFLSCPEVFANIDEKPVLARP